MRRDHPAVQVESIAKPAQGVKLQVGRIRAPRPFQCRFMLPQAAVKVATRETEIAAQVMDVEALGHEAGAHGRRFGLFKRFHGPGEVIDHPHAGRQPEPCAALLDIGFGKSRAASKAAMAPRIVPSASSTSPCRQASAKRSARPQSSVRPRSISERARSKR